MKLTFLGTKGLIEESSERHHYHSSCLLEYKKFKLLIDHGLISKPLKKIKPHAVFITHAHPDTFKWVKEDEQFNGEIHVTNETKKLSKFQKNFRVMKRNRWRRCGPFKILPYPVVHSFRAPAVGFKIRAGKTTIAYNSDLVVMKSKTILRDVDLYIGDGSSVRSNLVRRRGKQVFGHSRMQTQINWCRIFSIRNIIFTHLGREALRIGDARLQHKMQQEGMHIRIAHDGMKVTI